MWDPDNPGTMAPAADVLARNGLEPIRLEAKEGLAMINGTQMMSSLAAEAVVRAEDLALTADVACALSVEALKGTPRAFEECVHAVRPHRGQVQVANRLLSLLLPSSEIYKSHMYRHGVQDAYSLRCAPQVHGIAHDTIEFVERLLEVELNSATDNPMIFSEQDNVQLAMPQPEASTSDEPRGVNKTGKRDSDIYYKAQGGFVISGGNFHGEYPAKAADYLAIGVAELGNISERRLERLVNPTISALPAFLAHNPGLDSGFMIPHCTAAALVSENKVLCHPSSVDTISTSGSKEDHVSMGGFSARKALSTVENTEIVLAIEILAACAAIDLFRPLKTTAPLEVVYHLVRKVVPPLEGDRFMSPDIEAVAELVRSGEIANIAREATKSRASGDEFEYNVA